MEELKAALLTLIDERLTEHGLLEVETPAPTKGGKGNKKAAAAPADDEVTIDTLKEKLSELVNVADKDTAKALLKRAKVEKLTDLPDKHYAKFAAAIDAEIAKHQEGGDSDDLFGE